VPCKRHHPYAFVQFQLVCSARATFCVLCHDSRSMLDRVKLLVQNLWFGEFLRLNSS
jgi:hypothetical protein